MCKSRRIRDGCSVSLQLHLQCSISNSPVRSQTAFVPDGSVGHSAIALNPTEGIYAAGPDHTLRAAATKFMEESEHKRGIAEDAEHLKGMDNFLSGVGFSSRIHR
jgi:hypothetical protein